MITLRLVMRLGKPMEHLQAALRASASDTSSVETLLFIARHIGYFAFLSYDTIAWVCHFICNSQLTRFCILLQAHAVRFINLSKETAQRVLRRSSQFWFASILFSLAHGSLKESQVVFSYHGAVSLTFEWHLVCATGKRIQVASGKQNLGWEESCTRSHERSGFDSYHSVSCGWMACCISTYWLPSDFAVLVRTLTNNLSWIFSTSGFLRVVLGYLMLTRAFWALWGKLFRRVCLFHWWIPSSFQDSSHPSSVLKLSGMLSKENVDYSLHVLLNKTGSSSGRWNHMVW